MNVAYDRKHLIYYPILSLLRILLQFFLTLQLKNLNCEVAKEIFIMPLKILKWNVGSN